MRRLTEKLRSFLAANESVAAVLDGRIYIGHVPQKATLPALWMGRRASDDAAGSLEGAVGEEPLSETFDLEAIADDYAAAEGVAATIRSVLHHYRGTWDGVRIQGVFVRDATDDYQTRSDKSGSGFFVAALNAEVFADQA